jgi:hypothetical protein
VTYEILDELKGHPLHVHTLTASGGRATVRCLDCRWETSGTYREVADAWAEHVAMARLRQHEQRGGE